MDLEMTNLDPNKDIILEVAVEITDFKFKTLATYEATITHPKEKVLRLMAANAWWQGFPENRDEFVKKLEFGKPLGQVEKDLVALVEANFGSEPAYLAGNSIHSDRKFIAKYWPELDLKLHYRMLDVSSFKILMQGKYGYFYDKKEVHRAYDDIQASIAELQSYLDYFKNNINNIE